MKTGWRSLLLALVSKQLLLGLFLALIGPFTAEATSMRLCKAMCGETIAASCTGLRKGKLHRCRRRLLKECKHNRLDCAPPATTTTLAPATTTLPSVTTSTLGPTTTLPPVTTSTLRPGTTLPPVTTSTLGPTTTTTTIPNPCANPTTSNGTACDDHNACTTGDTCQGGSCVGSPVICPPNPFPSPCTTGTSDCNPSNGQCVSRLIPDGTACDDKNACTTGDSCQAGVCTGTSCAPGHTCCSTSEPCVDLQFDSNNCGACGNVCTNSTCLFGHCYDGCVINGAGYPNEAHNPDQPCQICDTSQTRTAWTNLGPNYPNPPTPTCTEGCFNGFCDRGTCAVTAQLGVGAGCTPSSSCNTASCNQNSICVQTPINDGAACTPPLSTNACLSPTTATCDNGQCVPVAANEGGFCIPASPPADGRCVAADAGTCHNGVCQHVLVPDGTSCSANQCQTGTCSGGVCQVSNVPDLTTCLPDSSNLCQIGLCVSGNCGQTFVNGTPEMKTCPDACGPGATCDPNTGSCGGHAPSFGATDCSVSAPGAAAPGLPPFIPDPSKCCPGQLCLCPPTPAGIPQFCALFGCWNPADVPSG